MVVLMCMALMMKDVERDLPSWAGGRSVYLLWRDAYLSLPPTFGWGCLFFWLWRAA